MECMSVSESISNTECNLIIYLQKREREHIISLISHALQMHVMCMRRCEWGLRMTPKSIIRCEQSESPSFKC